MAERNRFPGTIDVVDAAQVTASRHAPMKAMTAVAKYVWQHPHMKTGSTVYLKLNGKGPAERWTLYEKFASDGHKNKDRQLLQSVFGSYTCSDGTDKNELGKNVMIEIGVAYVDHLVVREHLAEHRDRALAEKGYKQRPASHTGARPHSKKRLSTTSVDKNTNGKSAPSPTPKKIAKRPSGARVSAA